MRFSFSKKPTSHGFALTLLLGLLQAGFSQEIKPTASLVERELAKRSAAVQEGQMLLLKGDEAYQAGNFKDAVEAYAGARAAFPDSPTTEELRNAATQRYAQASVEFSKELAKKGQVADAKGVLEVVLNDNVSPDDPSVLEARANLDDPIRTNPALTGDHAKDVDQVRRRLYLADGAYDLGKFDESMAHYREVLKIDPYNRAARRGMERVASEKSRYYSSAYDQNRAEALMQVEREWELPLQPNLDIPVVPFVSDSAQKSSFIPLSNKIKRIVIPQFILEEATLMEAVELLRLRAVENDTFELVPHLKGINITVSLGDHGASPAKEILERRFDLRVSNVPVETILKYITEITQTGFKHDDFAVTISQRGAAGGGLISRSYRVPPDFLSNLSAGATEQAAEEDIFNQAPSKNGMLAKRMSAQETLAQQGVSFPAGASANFNGATNSLLVINTVNNHDIIQQIIDTMIQTEPVIISVRLTMIKVQKTILEELGFDWMLNDFSLGGSSGVAPNAGYLTGGTVGTGSIIDDFPVVPGNPLPRNPITAGNRSGDAAYNNFTLDDLLASGISRQAQQFRRAPGIVGVNGVINDTTIQMLIRGLNQRKAADVLATPAISTRSGQAASITMVSEFIYPSEYDPPELPQSVGIVPSNAPLVPATPTEFETRDTGIFLEVLPTADENRRYINVALKPTMTDFEGFVNYGSPINSIANGTSTLLTENQILMPVFGVKKVDSSLVIADGATIVVGGLLKESVITVNDKTPLLGDLPVVGRLFQSNGIQRNSTAILFLVNVEMVDPTGRPYRNR
jgi:general secretion pathway protein D